MLFLKNPDRRVTDLALANTYSRSVLDKKRFVREEEGAERRFSLPGTVSPASHPLFASQIFKG